jgi:homoserine kinase type II
VAVYTHVAAEEISAFLARFDVGTLLCAKGIAEGVENSNYLIETTRGRFILTLYERRVQADDLPFFLNFMNHLALAHLPVPRAIADQSSTLLHTLAGRPACLIQFLPGISVCEPSPALCHSVGKALARLHLVSSSFLETRPNSLSLKGWRALLDALHTAAPSAKVNALYPSLAAHYSRLERAWPQGLPHCTIHADLFPDNVLSLGDDVTGLIDFYFACNDFAAYDLAITLTAWSFANDGTQFFQDRAHAMVAGYQSIRPLLPQEYEALPLLAQGAALRFSLTRLYDWINTPPDAIVTRKDPEAFARRLDFYTTATSALVCGQ